MNAMLWFLMLVVLGVVSPSLYAQEQGGSGQGGEEAILIGSPLPLSGHLQRFGVMMKNALEMAAQDINDGGGINGRPIQLAFADDQGDRKRAEVVLEELTDGAGAVMLVGGYQSDVTYLMAGEAEERDIPFLICTAATDRITEQRWRNIYRLNPPVSEYTASLEDLLLKELHPKSTAVVYEDSMFGTDAAANMMSFLQDNGIEIRDLIGYSTDRTGPAYFRSLLAPLIDEPPDVIHMISYLDDGVELVKAIRQLQIPSQLTGSAAGFALPVFYERAGAAAEGLLVASLWSSQVPYPGAQGFHDAYLEKFQSAPSYHGAEAYSALLVAADALTRAQSLQPADIREALDRTAITTPFGPVRFYSYEDFQRQNSIRTQVLQVQGGQLEVVWPLDLATAAIVRTP